MAVLTNTQVYGNLRCNGLINTNSMVINGYDVSILNPSSNISGNETSAKLVSAKQVVNYIQSKAVTAVRNGNTVSWNTGWITAGQTTGTLSNVQSNQSLNAGGSVTLSAGWLNNAVTITANGLSGQTSGTAAAGDILSGKTAWVNGTQITGNMTSRSASNISGGASASYTTASISVPAEGYLNIPAGYYSSGVSISLSSLITDIDSDAAVGQILSGYKAYSETGKVLVGTMTNRGAPGNQTISSQGGSYTVQSGYYSSGFKVTASLSAGTVTPNTTLPSGSTAESTETAAGSYVKVGAGYYANTKYYKAKSLADQTSGTATAANILKDKTAWVGGSQITGTMTDNTNLGNKTISMSLSGNNYTGSYTIPAGYHAGTSVVSATVAKATLSVGGTASNASCTANINNMDSMRVITSTSGTAGTDYFRVKATASGSAGSVTPNYNVTSAGYVSAGQVNGTAVSVSVTADTTGKTIIIPKAVITATGTASSAACVADISNTDFMRIVNSPSGTAGTDYFRVKATATGTAGSVTPKYVVDTNKDGYVKAGTVSGTAVSVSVTADTTGKSINIPKATFTTSGASIKTTSTGGGYVKDNTTVGTISNGSVSLGKGSISGNNITSPTVTWDGVNYSIAGSTTVTHAHATPSVSNGYVTSSQVSTTGGATKTVSVSGGNSSNALSVSVKSGQTLTVTSDAGTTNYLGWTITKTAYDGSLAFKYNG